MLLNLSNHPSLKWSKEQRDLAQLQFSEIIDMPFPNISPTQNTEGVVAFAAQYCHEILNLKKQYSNLTVHLMGELSFCFALVGLLQRAGIQVVFSTTQRTVLEEHDGKKTAQFRFIQFRAYPVLS